MSSQVGVCTGGKQLMFLCHIDVSLLFAQLENPSCCPQRDNSTKPNRIIRIWCQWGTLQGKQVMIFLILLPSPTLKKCPSFHGICQSESSQGTRDIDYGCSQELLWLWPSQLCHVLSHAISNGRQQRYHHKTNTSLHCWRGRSSCIWALRIAARCLLGCALCPFIVSMAFLQ